MAIALNINDSFHSEIVYQYLYLVNDMATDVRTIRTPAADAVQTAFTDASLPHSIYLAPTIRYEHQYHVTLYGSVSTTQTSQLEEPLETLWRNTLGGICRNTSLTILIVTLHMDLHE